MSNLENAKEILEEIIKGKKSDMPKQFSPEIIKKLKARMSKNPGAIQSTKQLKAESDIKKLKPKTVKTETPERFRPKRPTKKPEGPKGFRRKTLDELKADKPTTLKRGGKVQKKSKKTGRLAKRGYGISR